MAPCSKDRHTVEKLPAYHIQPLARYSFIFGICSKSDFCQESWNIVTLLICRVPQGKLTTYEYVSLLR